MVVLGTRLDDTLHFVASEVELVATNPRFDSFEFYERKNINSLHTTAWGKKIKGKLPKRRVPLTNTVRSTLIAASKYAANKDSTYLVPTFDNRSTGDTPLTLSAASRLFRRAFDELAKQCPNYFTTYIKAHSARKLFCQRIYDKTGDWSEVSRLVGHRSIGVTKRYIKTKDGN